MRNNIDSTLRDHNHPPRLLMPYNNVTTGTIQQW